MVSIRANAYGVTACRAHAPSFGGPAVAVATETRPLTDEEVTRLSTAMQAVGYLARVAPL